MLRRRVAWLAAALLSAFALIGCASIPAEDVRTYASAFEEARAAGYILLDKISPIIAKRQQGTRAATLNCEKDFTGTPRCFNPRLVGPTGRPPEPTIIIVRRAALDLIATYNAILLDLADGRSEAEIQEQIGKALDFATEMAGLVGMLGVPAAAAALPALSTLRGPLQALIGRFARARATIVTRQAIIDGRDTVRAILLALADETPKYYVIYRAQRLIDLVPLRTSGNQAGQQAILDDINAYHASLASYTVLIHKTLKAQDTLVSAAERGGQASPQNVRDVVREAVELRLEAKKFWDTVRRVRDASS